MATLEETKFGALAERVKAMLTLEAVIEKMQEALKATVEKHKSINEVQIPELMMELDVAELKLTDGTKVSVTQHYSAAITQANEEQAFEWLEDHEAGALIKSKVAITFGKGEKERKAEAQLIKTLEKMQVPYDNKRGVHASTLKAFVIDRLKKGQVIDMDLFSVHETKKTKVSKK